MDNHQGQSGRPAPASSTVWEPRYRMLDVWRGLACLMVVVHHAGDALAWADAGGSGAVDWLKWLTVLAVRRMNLGVPLFFVISGYCIAASAASTARKGGSPWSFMGRRFWRIYPPYWAALLGFVAIVVALEVAGHARLATGPLGVELDPPRSLDWRQWMGNLTLTETWRPHVFGPDRNVYTGVAWSLCFEEQFYLICFLALWLAPKRFYAALGAATLAIVSFRVWYWHAGALNALRGTFPMLWHEFAVGLAVFYRLNVARTAWPKRLIELGLAALWLIGLWTNGRGTATAAAFGLTLIALRRWDATWTDRPWLAPFLASGRRCYSIYLAHLPFVVVGNRWMFEHGLTGFWARTLVTIPLVSLVGVAAGWAFHAVVETRFLNPPPPSLSGVRRPSRPPARRWPALSGRRATSQPTAAT